MSNVKVTLPREVAEAIERTRCWNLELIRSNSFNTPESDYGIIDRWIMRQYDDKDDGIKMYFSALVNGYTVEKTPEEKVREYYEGLYETARNARENGGHYGGFSYEEMHRASLTIKTTLDLLGVKITGVNAP